MTKLFFALITLSSFSLYASEESPLDTSWMSPEDAALMQKLPSEHTDYFKTLSREKQRKLLLKVNIESMKAHQQHFLQAAQQTKENPEKYRELNEGLAAYGCDSEKLLNACAQECSDKISSLQDELRPLEIEEKKSKD